MTGTRSNTTMVGMVTLGLVCGALSPGCKKAQKHDKALDAPAGMTVDMTADMAPKTPTMGPAPTAMRPEPARPRPVARPVAKLAGDGAPPAALAKALGAPPQMVLRANLASWMTAPLMKPLVAIIAGGLKKEYGACADQIDVHKAKKAFYIQSSGRFIRRASDAAKDSHYIIVDTGSELEGIFRCLVKSGAFSKVKLNGGLAYKPSSKKKQIWWLVVGKSTLIVVDGPWATRVKPGEGLLGTGKLLEQVGDEALRAWVVDFAPDIPRAVAQLTLGKTVVGRADVTWRDLKDAQEMAKLKENMAKRRPKLAALMTPLTITVAGKVSTFAFRASATEAQKLGTLIQMWFFGGGGKSSKTPGKAVDKERKADPAMRPAPPR